MYIEGVKFNFNTSYVVIKPNTLKNARKGIAYFNTSYVVIKHEVGI